METIKNWIMEIALKVEKLISSVQELKSSGTRLRSLLSQIQCVIIDKVKTDLLNMQVDKVLLRLNEANSFLTSTSNELRSIITVVQLIPNYLLIFFAIVYCSVVIVVTGYLIPLGLRSRPGTRVVAATGALLATGLLLLACITALSATIVADFCKAPIDVLFGTNSPFSAESDAPIALKEWLICSPEFQHETNQIKGSLELLQSDLQNDVFASQQCSTEALAYSALNISKSMVDVTVQALVVIDCRLIVLGFNKVVNEATCSSGSRALFTLWLSISLTGFFLICSTFCAALTIFIS
jgi:hypothetical protein